MGKKGSWFSALKKVFSSAASSKEKHAYAYGGSEKKKSKGGGGILKHGEHTSFIPLFREPSSIEKILEEADNQNMLFIARPPCTPSYEELPAFPARTTTSTPQVSSSRAAASPRARTASSALVDDSLRVAPPSPRLFSPAQNRREVVKYSSFRTKPVLVDQHHSATMIQATYRGYLARRSFRALRGLVRLQGVVRGQNVQRQTINAMKQMQLLVRVQTQIQSRRLGMLENQALHYQSYRNDKEAETPPTSLNQLVSEAGRNEDWDDSLLTKEEIEENLRKKVEAAIKRERALAYAYSHQLRKANPRSAQTPLDFRSNGFPRWWNWMECQLPTANPLERHQTADKNVQSMAPRPMSQQKQPSPRLHAIASNNMHQGYALDSHESGTPRSSRSTRAKQFYTPSTTPIIRTPPPNSSVLINRYTRPTTAKSTSTSFFDVPMNDTDSLTSCPPPLTAPNYMSHTVSAKAKKVRANSNPKERIPGNDSSKRRFSFPLTPNIASFKWNKESNQDSASHQVFPRHESGRLFEEISVGSAVSMPAIVGRKPFNRFV